MQSIKGKKESLLRVLGMVLILFGLLATIIFDYLILSINLYLLILMIFIPWFILIVLLKLEKDFFVDNMFKFFIALSIYTIIILIIGLFTGATTTVILLIMISISHILIILSWYFALSIFKKEKLIFLIGGIGYCIISAIFRIGLLIAVLGIFLAMSALLLVIVGILLVFIAEMLMKRKGLLNYV